MRIPIYFLTTEHVIAIYERMIKIYGGDDGIRDLGLLQSAVGMPKADYGDQCLHDGIAEMAAAYLFHLCKNHAFVDGNKRVAVVGAEMFIELNDMRLTATDAELHALTLTVAEGETSKDAVTAFFTQHVTSDSCQ